MNQIARPAAQPDGTPTAEDWAQFLHPLLASVSNPPSQGDFRKRIAAVAFSLPEVRRSMLTRGVQREMVAKCTHWPTAAEVARFFADAIRHEREVREYRERPMLNAPEPTPRTPEQIAAVRQAAAAATAHLRSIEAGEPELRAVRSAYLPTAHLAATRNRNPLVQAARAMQRAKG